MQHSSVSICPFCVGLWTSDDAYRAIAEWGYIPELKVSNLDQVKPIATQILPPALRDGVN